MVQWLAPEVRTDDSEGDAARSLVEQRNRLAQITLGNGQQRFVGEGAADKRNPEWEVVRTESGRSSDDGKIHQVHEICVVTEIGVELHRIGSNLLVGIDGASRWQKQQVDVCPLWLGLAEQFVQAIVGFEGIDRRVSAGSADDPAHDRFDVCGVFAEEVLDRGQTFRDPRTAIKKIGSFTERRKINFHSLAPDPLELLNGRPVELRSFFVAEELQLVGGWNSESKTGVHPGCRPIRGTRLARKRIVLVEALGDLPDGMRRAAGAGENGSAVERAAGGDDSLRAEQAARGLH